MDQNKSITQKIKNSKCLRPRSVKTHFQVGYQFSVVTGRICSLADGTLQEAFIQHIAESGAEVILLVFLNTEHMEPLISHG